VAKKPVLTHLCESMLRIECIYAEVAEWCPEEVLLRAVLQQRWLQRCSCNLQRLQIKFKFFIDLVKGRESQDFIFYFINFQLYQKLPQNLVDRDFKSSFVCQSLVPTRNFDFKFKG
jgi:hypothetical protein